MRVLSLIVRVLMLPVHVASMWLHRVVEVLDPPRYRIRGRCHNNGRCCHRLLLIEAPLLTWPLLRGLTRWWMQSIYPFVITDSSILDPDSGEYFRIVSCRNLHNRRCKEYWLRPRICREWPRSQHLPPVLFAGCGFYAEDSRGEIKGDASQRRSQERDHEVAALLVRFGARQRRSPSGEGER